MKLIKFINPEMFAALIDRIANEPIWDDWWKLNMSQIAGKCWYFSVESVPGIAIMSEIVLNREATWTLILFERPGKRYKNLVSECKAIVQELMEKCKLERMVTHTSSLNRAAQMIASHIGFTRDGVGRRELHVNGVYQDCVHYSILKEEVNYVETKGQMGWGRADARAKAGAAEHRQLPGPIRDAEAGAVPRTTQRADEPVPQHGGEHADGDVRIRRGWAERGGWMERTDAHAG